MDGLAGDRKSGQAVFREIQQIAVAKRVAFWESAVMKATVWSKVWALDTPRLLDMGEDLCRAVSNASVGALVCLSSTCHSLRMLALPRLQLQREQAVRALCWHAMRAA
uniref:Uncharacterized protein n=1 Tax=Haptolina ericina TaxID=156174 RepID=A0A7S3B0P0_9EUKA|mmetsp:Transcript_45635/g.102841  ORF Transcript_45635/g.102841 Transcript_45635/m.102841 type:complete len:108 (+) Transcript_45635:11-334(+)